MHAYKKTGHGKLQRRVLIVTIIIVVIAATIGVPLVTNDDLRYDLAMRFGLIPGQSVEKLAEYEDGALLVVIPLDNITDDGVTPWLFKAQFIAWPRDSGLEVENLDTGSRAELPLAEIEFVSANGDGSLVLFRGRDVTSGSAMAVTVAPETMAIDVLPGPNASPDEPGDWETYVWDKTADRCHRASPYKRFVGCFTSPELSSFAAGDWELSIHHWGDFEELFPVFRGQGFPPYLGFAKEDTVIYFQNEQGIWRADVPDEALEHAPSATPYTTP